MSQNSDQRPKLNKVEPLYEVEPTSDHFLFDSWPTEYPCTITQAYGANPANYRKFYGDDRGHQGIDFRARQGTKIFCVATGLVKMVHFDLRPKSEGGHNFGIHCRVNHCSGHETIYAHMSEVLVSVGDLVYGGDVLGLAGNTGYSFGAHLHLHMKYLGRVIDPTPFADNLKDKLDG